MASQPYDVVVIGGGMAGLAAADQLRERRVLLVEREPRLGGRVATVREGGSVVDLGACFAWSPGLEPRDAPPPGRRIEERGPVLIFLGDALHAAPTVPGLLSSLMPEDLGRALVALFQRIHPGNMKDYDPARHLDALGEWFPDHYPEGNGGLVERYELALQAEVWLCANTVCLTERSAGVTVAIDRDGSVHDIAARAVVVATPATVARELITAAEPNVAALLEVVRYGRYAVVAFEVPNEHLEPSFRCLLTPDAKLTVVMQQASEDRRRRVLLCYYSDEACQAFADTVDDPTLVESTRREVLASGIGAQSLDGARSWVKRWAISGTLLSSQYAELKRRSSNRASRRLFLAGDYLAPSGPGYGIKDAVESGRSTGALIDGLLGREL